MVGGATSRALGTLLLASLGAACVSYANLQFAPPVQDIDLRGEADDLQGHVAITWAGVEEQDGVSELVFHVRFDNPDSTVVVLDPADFELLDAALTSIGVARVEDPLAVEAGGSVTFDILFPATAEKGLGAFALDALTVHTRLQGGRWDWSATFERAYPDYGGAFVDWGASSSWCHDSGGSRTPDTGGGFAQRSR